VLSGANQTTMSLLRKVLNSNILTCVLELIIPLFLSVLFVTFVDNRDIYDDDMINILFCIIFFLVLLVEWLRRFRTSDSNSKNLIKNYYYIGVMIAIFVLGMLYVNSITNY